MISVVVKPNLMVVHFEQENPQRHCPKCGISGHVHERPKVKLNDSHKLHMPFKVCWVKHVFVCKNDSCEIRTWTSADDRIAAEHSRTTTRAGRQMTREVAAKRSCKEVAQANGVSSKTVDKQITNYANQLFDIHARQLRKTKKIGIDETHLGTFGPYEQKQYTTNIVDLETGALIEILEGKRSYDVIDWFLTTPAWWRESIEVVSIDMCNAYYLVAETVFPNATVVVDRFHVVKLCNRAIDAMRSLVDPITKDHKRKNSVVYKLRKSLRLGMEKLSDDRFLALLETLEREDPDGYLTTAYLNKEGVRRLYSVSKLQARELIDEIWAQRTLAGSNQSPNCYSS